MNVMTPYCLLLVNWTKYAFYDVKRLITVPLTLNPFFCRDYTYLMYHAKFFLFSLRLKHLAESCLIPRNASGSKSLTKPLGHDRSSMLMVESLKG